MIKDFKDAASITESKYNFKCKRLRDGMLIEGLDYTIMTVTGYCYCFCCGCYCYVPSVGGRLAK